MTALPHAPALPEWRTGRHGNDTITSFQSPNNAGGGNNVGGNPFQEGANMNALSGTADVLIFLHALPSSMLGDSGPIGDRIIHGCTDPGVTLPSMETRSIVTETGSVYAGKLKKSLPFPPLADSLIEFNRDSVSSCLSAPAPEQPGCGTREGG
jgi:hypothetical protein